MPSTRRVVSFVLCTVLAACGSDGPVVPQGTTVALNGGNNQVVVVAAPLVMPLSVRVLDVMGTPMPGVPVSWSVVSGGGAITSSSPTDNDGVAFASYTAGTTSGPKSIAANINGATGSPVTFAVSVLPGSAKRLVKTSGDVQSAGPNTPLAQSLRVQVVDSFGNGVQGQVVNWTVVSGGGSIVPAAPVSSDVNGFASVAYTTGPTPGPASVAASAGTLVNSPIMFGATITSGVTLVKELPFTTTFVHDQFVRGGIVFICAWDQGLQIYDVGGGGLGGTPANPLKIGQIVTAANGVSGGAQVHNAWWYWAPNGAKRYV